MRKKLKTGKSVIILPLKDVALQEKYAKVNPNKGKKGRIKSIRPSRTGLVPSELIEPTTQDVEYHIELDDGSIITAPHEALELSEVYGG